MYVNQIRVALSKLVVILTLTVISLPIFASFETLKTSQLNIEASTGSAALGLKGKGIIPLYLTQKKVIWTGIEGSWDTKSKSYSGEIGGGYRQKINLTLGTDQNLILGGYAYLDLTRGKGLTNKRTVASGNIGGELYNEKESLSINGYIPLGKRRWTGQILWGSDIGKEEQVMQEHSEYDTKYQQTDMQPKWGADLEVGHTIPLPKTQNALKGYLGGYYYSQEKGDTGESSIKGISAKATYQINKYIKAEVEDTYDNYEHNAVMAGIELMLGKGTREEKELLRSPEHNLGSAKTQGEVNPITATEVQLTAGSQTIKGHSHLFEKVKHIYFFDQSGSENADGTYENPYSYADLTDGILSGIAQKNTDYSNIYITGESPIEIGSLTLYSNQNLEGRFGGEEGYRNPATLEEVSEMPILKGSLILAGGSEAHPQKISGIKLYNAGFSTGIQTESTSNGATYIELSQMQLGETVAAGNLNNYATGIEIRGGANVGIVRSNIEGTTNAIEVKAGESAGTITIGKKATLLGGTGAGIENSGTIESIGNEGNINSHSTGIENTGEIGNESVEYGINNAGEIGSIQGGTSTVSKGEIEGNEAGVNNSGTIGDIEYLSRIKGTEETTSFGIITTGNIGEINNTGTIEGGDAGIGVEKAGKIESIENLSKIEGTGIKSYGIYNDSGTIGNIVGGTSKGAAGVIEGGEVGINNQGGTIGNVSYLSKIEGTGSTSSYGIENTGTMGEIDNTGVIDSLSSTDIGIENTGTIGVFGTEVTTYGINNNGTIGNIIGGTSIGAKGTIEGNTAGIENEGGTIGDVSYLTKIEGTGKRISSYGIENEGTMGEIDNTGVIDSLSSTDIGIENTGTIGVSGTEVTTYGINNNGTIGNIEGGSEGTAGVIEGSEAGIENEEKGNIGEIKLLSRIYGTSTFTSYGIRNAGLIKEIINTGTIDSLSSSDIGIENTGMIGNKEGVYGLYNMANATIGNIIGGTSTGASGTIEGVIAGIYNEGGTIGDVSYLTKIEGAGTSTSTSYGIKNEGTMGEIENTGEIDSLSSTDVGIENTGTIGLSGTEVTTYGINNEGTIGNIIGGTSTVATGTIEGNTAGIENEGGTIGDVSYLTKIEGMSTTTSYGIENEGTMGEIDNTGTIDSLSSTDIGIKNIGTIGLGTIYGISNKGTIGNIIGGTSTVAIGTIEGNSAGVYNQGQGTIGNVSYLKLIEGTGTTGSSYGIKNAGIMGEIENTGEIDSLSSTDVGIENTGTIGLSGTEVTTYGINNNGTIGNIEGASSTTGSSGVIEGSVAGIENKGTIGDISYLLEIAGTGTTGTSYGIENEGTMGSIRNIGTVQGNSAGIENDGGMIISIASISEIEGRGEDSYGIENQGTTENPGTIGSIMGDILAGSLSAIEGNTAGIYNHRKGKIWVVECLSMIKSLGTTSSSYGIENEGTIGEIDNTGTIGSSSKEDIGIKNTGTIGLSGTEVNSYGIENTGTIGNIIGGTWTSLAGAIEGSVAGIYNQGKGTIDGVSYLSTIEGTGTTGASYGIENQGTIGDITGIRGDPSPVVAGTIEGSVAGIYNEGGTIGYVSHLSKIEGTGTTVTSYGIENEGKIEEINNTGTIDSLSNGDIGIENTGTIGLSGTEVTTYGINNEGTIGNIIGGTSTSAAGTIEGSDAGIENAGTIGDVSYLKLIEGTGTTGTSYGIENAGTIGEIDNTGTIDSLSSSDIGIENIGKIGLSGGVVTAYGIENTGTIGNIIGGTSTVAAGTIEGGEVGINNRGGTIGNVSYLSKIEGTGSASSYGIENTGTMGEINNTGEIDSLSSTDIGIENTGTIGLSGTEVTTYGINNNGTIGNIIGGTSTVAKGTIEGNKTGIYNEGGTIGDVSYLKLIEGTGTTVTSYGIENAGTIGEIDNTGTIDSLWSSDIGIENTGTIGLSGTEVTTYGINNEGTIGNIIGGTSTVAKGTIEGDKAGIYNNGSIGNIEYLSDIAGTGANSYGIENVKLLGTAGIIGDIKGNGLSASLFGIYNDRGTISNWDSIVNGTSGNTYTGSGSLYNISAGVVNLLKLLR